MSLRIETKNLNGSELLQACIHQRELAAIVREKVMPELQGISEKKQVHIFKQRRKGLKQITEKVERKRLDLDRRLREEHEDDADREYEDNGDVNIEAIFNPHHVEDTWACRFVTLLQYQIVEVFEGILEFACNETSTLSKEIQLQEIIVYSNRPKNDPNSLHKLVDDSWNRFTRTHGEKWKEHVVDLDKVIPREPRNPESGYSSLHIVLRVKLDYNYVDGVESFTHPFEIQIRDIFEEGWSEISHMLAYKPSDALFDEFAEIRSNQLLPARMPGLIALKAAADAVSQHATIIERSFSHLIDTAGLTGGELSLSSLGEDMRRILALVQPKGSETLVRNIRQAYDLAEQALKTSVTDIDNELARQYSAQAVEKFDELIEELDEEILDTLVDAGKQSMPVRFYVWMERANARVSAQSPSQDNANAVELIQRSIDEYEELRRSAANSASYTSDATIPLRLGQARLALAAAQEPGLARITIEAAIEDFEDARKKTSGDEKITSRSTYRWLPLQVLYEIGKAKGRLAEAHAGQVSEGVKLIEAVEASEALVTEALACLYADSGFGYLTHKCINNALYTHYMREVHYRAARHTGGLSYQTDPEVKKKMERYIELLMERPLKKFTEAATETIDSIMMAAGFLRTDDMIKLAHSMADQNISRLEFIARTRSYDHVGEGGVAININNYLLPMERILYERAVRTKFPHQGSQRGGN